MTLYPEGNAILQDTSQPYTEAMKLLKQFLDPALNLHYKWVEVSKNIFHW